MEPPPNGLNLDLWPAHSWDEAELSEFLEALRTFGPATGQRSTGARGLELQIIITVAAGAVAAGFLDALGADLYQGLKSTLTNLLFTRKRHLSGLTDKGRIEPGQEDYGFLRIVFPVGPTQFNFECAYSDEHDLAGFFNTAGKIQGLLSEDLDVERSDFRASIGSITIGAAATGRALAWRVVLSVDDLGENDGAMSAYAPRVYLLLRRTLLLFLNAYAADRRGPAEPDPEKASGCVVTVYGPGSRCDCQFTSEADLLTFFRHVGEVHARLRDRLAASGDEGMVWIKARSTQAGLAWAVRWRAEEYPFTLPELLAID